MRLWPGCVDFAYELHTTHAGHAHIGQHHVNIVLCGDLHGDFGTRGRRHRMSFANAAWQEELFLQFLVPLLTEVGRGDDQETAFTLCRSLGEDSSRFYSLAQAHFIRSQNSPGQSRLIPSPDIGYAER